jgi:SAM-dependent methyltransferase
MLKQTGDRLADGRFDSPAAERNKGPILEVLRRVLPQQGTVLEIASGSGQHIAHFAAALPQLTWQPSDPNPDLRESISMHVRGARNILPPLDLDVLRSPWPLEHADAIVCINMIHVAPWQASLALMQGATRLLPALGVLYLYGPYRRGGKHTAPSNAAFDAMLRQENPQWGVRDLEAVSEAAARHGFKLSEVVQMPANNLSVVFTKDGTAEI